ncbi:hypothetical protein [Streptomyces mesophilus]|uniref:hypothetical protein n=1 Tax=Streptomyces mesophilus TaxID=1775132 RepID=UPI0033280EFA
MAQCKGSNSVDHVFEAEVSLPEADAATLYWAFGARHVAEHAFDFTEARVRVRGVLLPAARPVPLHITVRTSAGVTEVMRTPAVAYYPQQLARVIALMDGSGPHWGADLIGARPRIAAMERIHRSARRDVQPALTEKEHV